jgi:hypothetical protein
MQEDLTQQLILQDRISRLPYEVMVTIYDMAPRKKELFTKVVHQLNLRNVFWAIRYEKADNHELFGEEWLYLVTLPEVDNTGRMEEMVEHIVKCKRTRHRILGTKPKRMFDSYDLMYAADSLLNINYH